MGLRREAIVLGCLASLAPVSAQARDPLCAADATPLALQVNAPDPRLKASIEAEFAAEQRRGSFCVSDDGAIAKVRIDLDAQGRAQIVVADSVTEKTVMRTVNVSEFPADAKPLALAIAADELLRASWAELTMPKQPQRPPPPSAVVARIAPKHTEPDGRPFEDPTEIGGRVVFAAFAGGQTQFGGAVFVRHDLIEQLTLDLYGYGREALPTSTALGNVLGHTGGGGLNLTVWLVHAGPTRFGAGTGVEIGAQIFEGQADNGGREATLASLVVIGKIGVELAVDLAPLRLGTMLSGLLPFRGFEAQSGDDLATGLSGPGISAAVGAGGAF